MSDVETLAKVIRQLEAYEKDNKRLEQLVDTYKLLVKKLEEKIEVLEKSQTYPNLKIKYQC